MAESKRKLRIGVIGPGDCGAEVYNLAEEVGRLIASANAVLICGGLGGVMEAAAKGAKSYGGLTIGILPGISEKEANPYIDIPIVTDMGQARNIINVLSSCAIIAISGGYGTLSEIAIALKFNRPVVGLKTWEFSAPGMPPSPYFYRADSAEEAVAKAIALAQSSRLP